MTGTASFAIPGLEIGPASKTQKDRMRVLIHGLPGRGKSTLASTIAQSGKTLYVDLVGERGSLSFAGTDWEKNIDIVRPDSVQQLTLIYKELAKGNHDYESVILDSLSSAQKMVVRFLLGREEDAVSEISKGKQNATQQTWGNVLDVMTDICTFWHSLADGDRKKPMNVVFTCQSKSHEDDEGNSKMYPDVSKGSRTPAMSTPNYVLYCDLAEVITDDGEMKLQHVVRLGPSLDYATKARIPLHMRGKIPDTLGLKEPLSLTALGQILGVLPKS